MVQIDFLPNQFHELNAVRKKRLWRLLVILLFGLTVASTAVFQHLSQRSVERKLAEVKKKHAAAARINSRIAALQLELQSAREQAELYTYLDHPWPRSQILAQLADALPHTVTFREVHIASRDQRTPQRSVRRRRGPGAASNLSPAKQAFKSLSDIYDRKQTVVYLSGTTTNVPELYSYVAKLGSSTVFAKAELAKLETVTNLPPSSSEPALSLSPTRQSSFEIRIVVRPGYGHPEGPRGNEGTANNTAATRHPTKGNPS